MNIKPEVKLTQTVQKGGCAAKVAAAELRQILSQVVFPPKDSSLIVDGSLMDDAAIYQVTEDIALVQTLDFFTPIVDDPKRFGEIAAANSLSDVYAMGGTPKTALAILAFPLGTMDTSVIVDVLQGASDKIREAKAQFVGGHSIDDDTLKFGLSVTGYVHPKKMWTNAGAKVGDVLILTKALGTGTSTAALKRGEVSEIQIEEALKSMAQLNNVIDILDGTLLSEIHAATDITGFGLCGHGMQMAKASSVQIQFSMAEMPILPRAIEFIERGFLTKAHRTNMEYVAPTTNFTSLNETQKQILFDPQTSGGLLLTVAPDSAMKILEQIQREFPAAAFIGVVRPQDQKYHLRIIERSE